MPLKITNTPKEKAARRKNTLKKPLTKNRITIIKTRVQLLTNAGIKKPFVEILLSKKTAPEKELLKHYLTLNPRQKVILMGLYRAVESRSKKPGEIMKELGPNFENTTQLIYFEQNFGREKMVKRLNE